MPNLLFIAYPFPPAPFSGANRTWPLAKYLSRLGWTVTVVSARDPAYSRRAASEAMADMCRAEGVKLITVGTGTWAPDDAGAAIPRIERLKSDWRRCSQGLLRRVLRMGDPELWCFRCGVRLLACSGLQPDAILATGMPFGSFVLARALSRYFGAPYVLDYRDPWTANPYRADAQAPVTTALEVWALSRASATVMVSPSQASAQSRCFPRFTQPEVLTNGYDPEMLSSVKEKFQSKCVIVYAGILYPGKRDLDPILAALARSSTSELHAARPLELHYYGPHNDLVSHTASKHGVSSRVVLHGLVSRAEVLSAVKSAHAAIVVTGMSDEASLAERGIVTGKIFEAIGLGTPVLLISPRDSDARQLLTDTKGGVAFCASQVDDIARWLVALASRPRISKSPPSICSWVTLSKRLDSLLRSAIAAPGNCTVPMVARDDRVPDRSDAS